MRQRVAAGQAQHAGRGAVARGDAGAGRRRRQRIAGQEPAGDRYRRRREVLIIDVADRRACDNVVGGPSAAYEADAATLLSAGALSTAVILTVVVCVALLSVPSLTTHEIVRLRSAPKLVGFWLLDE